MAAALRVEVLTASGCNRCQHTKDLVKRLVAEQPHGQFVYREVDVVKELDYAVSLGVLSTPAVAIGGVLVFTAPPSGKKLRKALQDSLLTSSFTLDNT